MIVTNKEVFILNTKNLTHVFHANKTGLLLHDYFGGHIDIKDFDISGISQKLSCTKGTSTIYKEEVEPNLCMDTTLLEFSFPHKGDYRRTPVLLRNEKSGYVFDFNYEKYEIRKSPLKEDGLPAPHDNDEELVVYLFDKENEVQIELHYVLFYESDVIARNIVINNLGKEDVHVLKALSIQLDMINQNYQLVNLVGGWASEMNEEVTDIKVGVYSHESRTGFSSHKVNPLFLLKNKETSLNSGDAFIFNLIYSGNHIQEVELTPYGYLRVEAGINPYCFDHTLKSGEHFSTPYAVVTYSNKGINDARSHMHQFVNEHVIASRWKEALRPVVINNWEGTYFKFKESKVLSIAKKAHKYGAELFVLDDGWFGERNDDFHGLGDYNVNKKKLPHGLKGLANKVNKMGMKFGLWFEPEAVNPQSELFKLHPEWVIRSSSEPSLARHELLLDLSKPEVQQYIIDNVSATLDSANIEYVKWDMNRHMSDPSNVNFGEFYHNYIVGLYKVLKTLTEKYPHVLFEGCASGGNRFDLGILSYCPQIWASDDTDSYERLFIQRGYLYGYPLSTLSNHVSAEINHQTLRKSSIDSRFNTACFGVLGYELLFSELNKFDKNRVLKLIEIYKQNRDIFQFGEFFELESNNGHIKWQVLSKDRSKSVVGEFAGKQSITPSESVLSTKGLKEDVMYSVDNVEVPHNIKEYGGLVNIILPFHVNPNGKLVDIASRHITIPSEQDHYKVYGSVLNNKGVILTPEWSASGQDVRLLRDFGSRLYLIKEIKDE